MYKYNVQEVVTEYLHHVKTCLLRPEAWSLLVFLDLSKPSSESVK